MFDNFFKTSELYRRESNIFARVHIDLLLLIGILILLGSSLLIVYSASGGDLDVTSRHAVRMSFALGIMFIIAQLSPKVLFFLTPLLFTVGFLMLVAVPFLGDVGKGAQRWLVLGPVRFQPSELMKVVLPMMVAWIFAQSTLPVKPGRLILALAVIGSTTALIMIQPDLGTSLLIAMSGLFVVFFGGIKWRLIFGAMITAAASIPLAWQFVMHDYQKQRVLTFLDPESDPLGTGYHIIQSKIAIGSGGVEGKGFLNSTQAHLEFLPESTTDFIFSVLSEEFGLIGVILLLVMYLFVIGRGLYISSQAQDNFTRLVAGSLTMTLFIYVFVNIGMVSGLLPVVGLPLPLISYGGSSMVTLMISFGILMSIQTHRKLLSS